MPKLFTYQKKDKLKSRKQTQNLFSNGKSIGVFPIKLIYTVEQVDTEGILQAGVGAPTRTFRKAVQRNRVKRLLREAYRLEKPTFLTQFSLEHKRINLFFRFVIYFTMQRLYVKKNFTSGLLILLLFFFSKIKFVAYGFDNKKSKKNYTYYDVSRLYNFENEHDLTTENKILNYLKI